MSDPYVSIIIPAYSEAGRIEKTLKRLDEYLKKQNCSYEILVVVDGAKDNTAAIVRGLINSVANLRLIENKENRGKGFVVRQGMLAAKGQYRVFTDADNSTDIAHLEKMIAKFREGLEVVIGSREARDAVGAKQAVSQAWYKRLLGDMGNLFIQLLVVPGIWDTQNGFKGFSAQSAQRIFSKAKINRWGFDIEALALARKLDYKIGIIPVYWKNDPLSHVKFSGYLRTLWETVQIRLNLWFGKYGF